MSASIDWGDSSSDTPGAVSGGILSGLSNLGHFDIYSWHQYASGGLYTATSTVTGGDPGDQPITVDTPIRVLPLPNTLTPAPPGLFVCPLPFHPLGFAEDAGSLSNLDFTEGAEANVQVVATGFPLPALSVSGPLPNGVRFTDNGDGTASLAGVPTAGAAGTYPIIITATNGVGSPAQQSFDLGVSSFGITTQQSAIPSATPGVRFTFYLGASGGQPPYKWKLLSGSSSLPKGLKLKRDGELSGLPKGGVRPDGGGIYRFRVQAQTSKRKGQARQSAQSNFYIAVG